MSEKESKEVTKPSKTDERNLVEQELNAELPPEEKIKLWWERNRAALALGVIIALLVMVGFQGLRIYRQSFDAKVQEAWLAIDSEETRLVRIHFPSTGLRPQSPVASRSATGNR